MKTRILSAIIIILSCSPMYADFKILYLNTPSITVNGQEKKVADVIPDNSRISWSSPRQAIKVLDLASGKQKLVVAEAYKKSKATLLKDFIAGKQNLSSRDGLPDNIVSLRKLLSDDFYYLDSLRIETAFPTDEKRFFFVSYDHEGETINKMIPNSEGSFILTDDIFIIDGVAREPHDTELSVYYMDENKGTVTLITGSMMLHKVPEN